MIANSVQKKVPKRSRCISITGTVIFFPILTIIVITAVSPTRGQPIQTDRFQKIIKKAFYYSYHFPVCATKLFVGIIGTNAMPDPITLNQCSVLCGRVNQCVGFNYLSDIPDSGMCRLIFQTDLTGWALYYKDYSGCYFYKRFGKPIQLIDEASLVTTAPIIYTYMLAVVTGSEFDAGIFNSVQITMKTVTSQSQKFTLSGSLTNALTFLPGQTDVFELQTTWDDMATSLLVEINLTRISTGESKMFVYNNWITCSCYFTWFCTTPATLS